MTKRIQAKVLPGDDSGMEHEVKTVERMIEMFCRGQHGGKNVLCPECRELLDYVTQRLEKCSLKENKPKCSKCPVHCYKPDMREKIKAVMRYSGPRMLCRHPILTGRYYLSNN